MLSGSPGDRNGGSETLGPQPATGRQACPLDMCHSRENYPNSAVLSSCLWPHRVLAHLSYVLRVTNRTWIEPTQARPRPMKSQDLIRVLTPLHMGSALGCSLKRSLLGDRVTMPEGQSTKTKKSWSMASRTPKETQRCSNTGEAPRLSP